MKNRRVTSLYFARRCTSCVARRTGRCSVANGLFDCIVGRKSRTVLVARIQDCRGNHGQRSCEQSLIGGMGRSLTGAVVCTTPTMDVTVVRNTTMGVEIVAIDVLVTSRESSGSVERIIVGCRLPQQTVPA